MRIIKINYCNHCPYFKSELEEKEVNKNYKGIFLTDNDGNKKYINELKAYCLGKEKGNIVLIKNLGKEIFELDNELAIKMDKEIENDYDLFLLAENKLFNNYMKKLKIEIPNWCPLEEI